MSEKLKYPVLLVHGMGFRDSKRISYWGRIPAKLNVIPHSTSKTYDGNFAEPLRMTALCPPRKGEGGFFSPKIKEIDKTAATVYSVYIQ